MTISRENPIALYLQIAETLKKDIFSEVIQPGKRIGTQKELEERFNVSKITIRKAIEVLENEGLVVTSQGKGTYVRQEKVEQTLDELQSLSDIIKKSGYDPEVKIIKMKKQQTEDSFLVKETTKKIDTLAIERVHFVEKKPIALAKAYIPWELGKHLSNQELEHYTIYELLENKLGIKLSQAEQAIEACPASEELGKILNVQQDSPLLKASRLTYSTDNQLVEKIIFYYRYDVFAFKVNLNSLSITPMWPTIPPTVQNDSE
ncbi:GntR family transcriptional regulator [Ornithinibacillus sp. 4-3]|uniref:GntR family transcriptional regulator n=1 Tax=Ornithinibacillus sp. 4-3 TaxID=3231488 RepID=A0AB39HVE7_9BACI